MQAEDESNITELEILPDGRICVFGASREVLEIFQTMQIESQSKLIQRLKQDGVSGPADISSIISTDQPAIVKKQRNHS
ncbi:hypothetical protein [Gimesia aquarii]|uniref:Uncharacterized protein n=1 Tax=Gimesia aquarii TaxID=2527964 RepID=A0A517VVW8_9PLAN|nr:hypothetical protein [Gimesia aquarii]QDT97149.1 hypothetical protein V144x_26200 [Gimesia aquarii]